MHNMPLMQSMANMLHQEQVVIKMSYLRTITINRLRVNLLVNASAPTIQSIFSTAAPAGAEITSVITNVLNTIYQYEGDLAATDAIDNIIETLLLDASSLNPVGTTSSGV